MDGRRGRLALSMGLLLLAAVPALGAQGASVHANYHAVCPGPALKAAHCHALVETDEAGNPDVGGAPVGLSPARIQAAYGFPTEAGAGAGQTIAIVDAFDDPTAESDLSTFSAQFGLPACTTANGCFQKVNQTGGAAYPAADSGWALEISLDVQWAHAIAPGARILLVEATTNSYSDLLAAEDYARTHAQYVSNSWGSPEFSGETLFDSHFRQSGVSVFVSAGDAGLPAGYPSSSPDVISVGGTTLHFDGTGAFESETGWSSGGGGCSSYETATAAQFGFAGYGQAGCGGRRATPDVSLDADPASGVAVYDSTPYSGSAGWFTVGGTSASAPMWAARSADAGVVVDSPYVYGSGIGFRDVTSGNNGAPCLAGYDLCTGRGSWASSGSQAPGSLSFSTSAQALTAGAASAAMQLSLSTAQASSVSVALASSSGGGRFSLSAGGPWTAALSVSVPALQTASAPFFYEDTAAGAPTLSASAGGFTGATQTETVAAGPLASVIVSPGSATVAAGGTASFGAAGADQYGNPVGVVPSWSTTVPGGSVAPGSGTTTTFAAPPSAASGAVTAAAGGISGSAAVTVTGLAAPTNLIASAQSKRRILLTWTGSGSGVTYRVYRGSSSGSETFYASAATTSFTDGGVSSRSTYWYRVTAVSGGAESLPSNEASARAR